MKILKAHKSHEGRREKGLLEKARREMNYEEAEEPKAKEGAQKAGDIFGAIILELLILFIVGILAALLAGRK